MITTQILGGLGNQMFQYVVALSTDQTLKLDLTAMKKYRKRPLQIDQLSIAAEIAWARSNLQQIGAMTFIEPQSAGRDAEEIHLMAACRSHIIANSTFSWWGAWMNPRPDKSVIAPARWVMSAEHDTRDVIPSSWERL